jgi:catechol 2,3-dioxygenase-like lactoylglutathione lyase family enzyme
MRVLMPAALCLAIVLPACRGKSEREPERNAPLVAAAQACTRDAELACPRPIFTVRDLRASQRYYRDALGFKLDWDYGDPPDFGSVSRADSQLFMCQGCQGKPGAWIMIYARDVDRLHDEIRRKGAIIQMPPTDMPWGLREMQVADPDGNVIRFGSAIDHDH